MGSVRIREISSARVRDVTVLALRTWLEDREQEVKAVKTVDSLPGERNLNGEQFAERSGSQPPWGVVWYGCASTWTTGTAIRIRL